MGRELDSLADVISFGVAPACLAYAVGHDGLLGRARASSTSSRAASAGSRATTSPRRRCRRQRARSRTSRARRSPPASLLVLLLVGARAGGAASEPASRSACVDSAPCDLHPLVLLFVLSGSLMISKTLRIPKPCGRAPLLTGSDLKSVGSSRGRGPRGNAARSGRARPRSAAGPRPPRSRRRARGWRPWGSRTATAAAARNRSATWRGVAPCAAAISCSTRPPAVRGPGKCPVAERAVGDHGDAVLLAPGQHGVLDRALLQVVEDLVAGDAALAGDRPRLLEVGHVEVAHAPGEDLALAPELLEGRDRVLQRMLGRASAGGSSPAGRCRGARASRSQAATVPPREAFSGRTLETRKTSSRRPAIASATISSAAPAVHLRGVDVGHAEVEAPPQGGDRGGAVVALDVPGPLADHRDLARRGAEPAPLHAPCRDAPVAVRLGGRRSSRRAISAFGWTPTMRSTSRPPLSTSRVGMLLDAEARRRRGILVHVELREAHAPRHLRRQLVEHRRDHPARPAPRRPQVEQHRQRRALDLGRERRVGDGHRLAAEGQRRLAPPADGLQAALDPGPGNAVDGAARRATDHPRVRGGHHARLCAWPAARSIVARPARAGPCQAI